MFHLPVYKDKWRKSYGLLGDPGHGQLTIMRLSIKGQKDDQEFCFGGFTLLVHYALILITKLMCEHYDIERVSTLELKLERGTGPTFIKPVSTKRC